MDIVIFAIIVLVIGFAAYHMGIAVARFKIQSDAVKHGCGRFEIVNPETGETKFIWNEPCAKTEGNP